MAEAERFLLIGDSSEDRFPALSFHNYTATKKSFYCLDLGGLTEARGKSAGKPVFARVEDVPDDVGDLAVIWTKPHTASRAVDAAHTAGCTQVWFSFQSGHKDAVAKARDLGLTVVEIGRCPVHYCAEQVTECRLHTGVVKLTGTYKRPPQTDPTQKRRELY